MGSSAEESKGVSSSTLESVMASEWKEVNSLRIVTRLAGREDCNSVRTNEARRTAVLWMPAANSETANISDVRHMTGIAERVEESEWDCVKWIENNRI